jgi:alpha-amylase/alpha-mannosidase (GH57 family)
VAEVRAFDLDLRACLINPITYKIPLLESFTKREAAEILKITMLFFRFRPPRAWQMPSKIEIP